MTLRRTDSPQGLGVLSVFILKSHTHFDPKLSLSSAFNLKKKKKKACPKLAVKITMTKRLNLVFLVCKIPLKEYLQTVPQVIHSWSGSQCWGYSDGWGGPRSCYPLMLVVQGVEGEPSVQISWVLWRELIDETLPELAGHPAHMATGGVSGAGATSGAMPQPVEGPPGCSSVLRPFCSPRTFTTSTPSSAKSLQFSEDPGPVRWLLFCICSSLCLASSYPLDVWWSACSSDWVIAPTDSQASSTALSPPFICGHG